MRSGFVRVTRKTLSKKLKQKTKCNLTKNNMKSEKFFIGETKVEIWTKICETKHGKNTKIKAK